VTRHRATRRAVIALVAAVAAWLGSGVIASLALTHRTRPRFAEPAPDGFASVHLASSDGLGIGGWWSRDASAPTGVVLAHGNGASRSALIDRARTLRSLGCDVLSISLRAHGDSDGEWNDIGWSARHDVAAAVRALRDAQPERPVVLFGVSLGAAASLFAESEVGELIDGAVLVAPFSDLRLAVRRRTQRYLPPGIEAVAYAGLRFGALFVLPDLERTVPVDAARRLRAEVPLLIAVGSDDSRAPPSDAEAIAEAHPNTQIVELSGAEHEEMNEWDATEGGRAALETFLARFRRTE
jgi:pimeloyl-ACP methyl ester carboxylesterase